MKTQFLILVTLLFSATAEACPTCKVTLTDQQVFEFEPARSLWWPATNSTSTVTIADTTSSGTFILSPTGLSYDSTTEQTLRSDISALRERGKALEKVLLALCVCFCVCFCVFVALGFCLAVKQIRQRRDLEALNRQMNPPPPPADNHPMRESGESPELYFDGATCGVHAACDEVTAVLAVVATAGVAAVGIIGLVGWLFR